MSKYSNDPAEHFAKGIQHCDCADSYSEAGKVKEWEIVMRFYSAIHFIDAYLFAKGVQEIENHRTRSKLLREYPELSQNMGKNFIIAYNRLYDLCHQVRYDAGFSTVEIHLIASRGAYQTIANYLKPKAQRAIDNL